MKPIQSTPRAIPWSRRRVLQTGAIAAASAALPWRDVRADPESDDTELSFLVVGDTHYLAPAEAPDSLDPHILGVNRRLIRLLNDLPGTPLPAEMGGGVVRRPAGVIHLGDMIDSGDKGTAELSVRRQATEWRAYTADFGPNGREEGLHYPVYEVHGNHDSVRERNVVIEGLIERTKQRPGLGHVSENGLHYSWDWAGVHFIALGIIVGHNDAGLPVGRYAGRESLEFLRKDLSEKVGDSGRPVVLLHHVDLLRYSTPCGKDSESGGEWSACDVAAYHRAIKSHNIAAVFHGHLHALRADRWNGTPRGADEGIPVFGNRNSGAGGGNRGFFYCTIDGNGLTVREMASVGTPDGWSEGSAKWSNCWTVPLRNRAG